MSETKFWRSGYAFAIAAILFMLAGLYTFYGGFSGLLFNLSVSTWDRIDAQVKSVETITIYAARKQIAGYYLIATYSYHLDGGEVVGNAVAPDATFGYDQVLLSAKRDYLKKLCVSKEKLKIFVNSKDQAKAYLFRNKPIQPYIFLLAGSLFLTTAFILLLVFLKKKQNEDSRDKNKIQFPEQPWRWESFWQTFELRTSSNISKIFPIWGLTIFLGIVSILSATIVGWSGGIEVPIYFGVAILFLVWLVSVKLLVSRVKGLRMTTGIKLVAASYPIVIGEKWHGSIILPNKDQGEASNEEYLLHMLPERSIEGYFQPLYDVRKLKEANAMSGVMTSVKMSEMVDHAMSKSEDVGQLGRTIIEYTKSVDGKNSILDFEILISDKMEETNFDAKEAFRWMIELSAPDSASNVFERFPIPVFKRSSFSEPQVKI